MLEALTLFHLLMISSLNPIAVTVFSILCILVATFLKSKNLTLPRKILLPITLIVLAAHFLSFGTFLGRTSSSALIACAAGLKFFEVRTDRDHFALVLVNFLLINFILLEKNDILTTLSCFVSFSILGVLLFDSTVKLNLKQMIRLGLITFSLSLPLATLLFVFVPQFRISLPSLIDAQATTGFSENLNPGDITQLSQSNRVAFQAVFPPGKMPSDQKELYWRGLILSDGSGLSWRQTQKPKVETAPSSLKGSPYTLHIPADQQTWIFSLEGTRKIEAKKRSLDSFSGSLFRDRKKRKSRQTYFAELTEDRSHQFPHQQALEVDDSFPKTRDLAKRLKATTPDQSVRNIINWFIQQKFEYSLTPPPTESIDHFLFESRVGFCEHFAASVATLFRLAGVPANVVVGFQGGETLENFITVRFKDAHAWTEFYSFEEKKWLRFDPTSLVARERLELGGSAFQSQRQASFLDDFTFLANRIEAYWFRYVLSYDFNQQLQLFHWGNSWWSITIMILFPIGVLVGLFYLSLLLGRGQSRSVEQITYRLISYFGGRDKTQGPRSFSERYTGRKRELLLEYEKMQYQAFKLPAGKRYLWSLRAIFTWLFQKEPAELTRQTQARQ